MGPGAARGVRDGGQGQRRRQFSRRPRFLLHRWRVRGQALISYAGDDAAHEAQVIAFCEFLRGHGVDALIDREVADRPQYWPDWMSWQIRTVRYILVIASPDYRAASQ